MRDLSDLSYSSALKVLRRTSNFKDPKSLYALYFYFEQLGYENCLKHIYNYSCKSSFTPEFELIKARFHLFHPSTEADDFFTNQESLLKKSDYIYYHFLASAYFEKTKRDKQKKIHSEICLKHYDNIGDYNRYMTSLAHKNDLSLDDLKNILNHSMKTKQFKASGVSYIGLAKKVAFEKDHEYALHYLDKAQELFIQKHHDPRRLFEVRLAKINSLIDLNKLKTAKNTLSNISYTDSSSLTRIGLVRLNYIKKKHNLDLPNKVSSIDFKLLELISKRSVSRDQLKDKLWPNHKEMIVESIDERLRSSIYRLKKHYKIPIFKNKYNQYSLAI